MAYQRPSHKPLYIKAWRKYRGYTVHTLAPLVGLSASMISQLEQGKAGYTQPSLEALAQALRVPPAALFRDPAQTASVPPTNVEKLELLTLREEVRTLREENRMLHQQTGIAASTHYVTLKHFAVVMLGYKDVVSYYNHRNDAGFPQRVYPAGSKRPMLVYEECIAYQERRLAMRGGKTPPPKPDRRGKRGRPVKPPRPKK